jgi:Transposase
MSEETFTWFVGIDWGSEKHQVCVLEQQGTIVGERSFPHSGTGLAELGDWLLSIAPVPGSPRAPAARQAARRNPAEMCSPQQVDELSEQEGQQHRERDGNQHRAAEVEPSDHDDRDGDGQQTAQTGGFSRRDLGQGYDPTGRADPASNRVLLHRASRPCRARSGRHGLSGELFRAESIYRHSAEGAPRCGRNLDAEPIFCRRAIEFHG